MKKVVWFIGFFACMFLCVNNAQASGFSYADGWFDQNSGKYTIAPGYEAILDNNLSTGVSLITGKKIEISFKANITVESLAFYLKSEGNSSFADLKLIFYKDNQKVHENRFRDANGYIQFAPPVSFNKIVFESYGSFTSMFISEFEVFDQDTLVPAEFKSISAGYEHVDVSVIIPKDAKSVSFYVDGVNTGSTKKSDFKISGLKTNTEYEIAIASVYESGVSRKVKTKIKTKQIPEIKDEMIKIIDLTSSSATLEFNLKEIDVAPKTIIIEKSDGSKVQELKVWGTDNVLRYTLQNLNYDTEYKYNVKFLYKDDVVRMKKISFQTSTPNKEVERLTATSTNTNVELSWKMPKYKDLDVARIYRKKNATGFLKRMFKSSDAYEEIFETNGTTFKDLTVKADTEYTYKVTTVDKSGNETKGETVVIKTKKMNVSGGEVEKDPNGDYVITWTSPTKGKIKVLVGRVEYAIVPASDKKIVIPKDKMKFDILGNPEVLLIPIDEDGNEGESSKPSAGEGTGNGGGIGDIIGGGEANKVLNPTNVLKGGMELIKVIGGFILLGLAFLVVPRLVKVIRNSFDKPSNSKRRVG